MDPLSKNSENNSKDGDIKALMDGSGESTENIVRPGECTSEGLEDSSDLEGDMPFEPYDVNCDGRIMKTASQYSRDAWKHPEPEWEVAVTVHGFCEIATISTADDTSKGEDVSSSKETRMNKVEPNLQLEFKLGKDEHESFPQGVIDQAKAAGVELNPLLHSAIASMVRNERASFSVSRISADEARVDGETKPTTTTTCRLEYDISLDAWTEEIDLSDHDDGSLVKRVMRDGDGAVEPTEVGKVTVRCRITRKCFQSQGLGEETVVFDNLRSQDCSSEEDDALEGPLTFVLDDCPFGSGFTVIIKSMRTGELCEARLEPEYAPAEYLGDESFQHHAVVELLEVEDLPPVWSTDDVRLEMAKRFKLEGNEKFTAGDFIRALRRYEKAIQYADGVPPGNYSDEDGGFDDSPSNENERGYREDEVGTDERSPLGGREVEFVDLQVAILCNQAACHLKLGDGAAALEVADRASTFKTPVDGAAGVKAAYRRACALEAVGDLDEARVAFKSVLDVNPKNSQCIQGLARIARAEKAYQARLRKAFGGCLTSGKLKGFASEGREMSSETRQGEEEDGEDSFDARQRHLADGSWSDDSSSSETEENDDSYDEDLPLLAKGNKGSADVDQSPSVIEDSVSKAAERVQVSETACTGSGGSLSLSLNPAGDSPTGEQEMDEKLLNRSCSRSPQTGELSNSNENIGAKLVTEVLPPPPPQA